MDLSFSFQHILFPALICFLSRYTVAGPCGYSLMPAGRKIAVRLDGRQCQKRVAGPHELEQWFLLFAFAPQGFDSVKSKIGNCYEQDRSEPNGR